MVSDFRLPSPTGRGAGGEGQRELWAVPTLREFREEFLEQIHDQALAILGAAP